MIYSPSIFVVIDPVGDNQQVLDRVSDLTKNACSRAHLFLSDYPEKEQLEDAASMKDAKNKFHKEKLDWLGEIAKPLENDRTKISCELYWNKDWHEAIPHAAVRRGSNLIVKSTFAHSKSSRTLTKTSDFMLIRRCVSPILFVKEGHVWKNNKILAAINLEAAGEEHTRLNEAVIQRAKTLAQLVGMDVHLISSISEQPDFSYMIEDETMSFEYDEEAIAQYYGVDADKIFLSTKKPKEAIVETATQIGADVVIVGSVGRSGISGALIGNTAEKILDELVSDVLVVT